MRTLKIVLAALLLVPCIARAQNVYLGDFHEGQVVYVYFPTFSGTGASVTISGFALGDVVVYKDDSTTQRTSTAGMALLDTDGIDFDGVTGTQGFKIDLADNTDANFWQRGHDYQIVAGPFTADGSTVYWHNHFSIENRAGTLSEMLITTVSSVTDQQQINLAKGGVDNEYNDHYACIDDVSSLGTRECGWIKNSTASSNRIRLDKPMHFTVAAGDVVHILTTTRSFQ